MEKNNSEILLDNANKGFKEFEKKLLKLSKENIFDKAFEINAKNEIHGYLCDCSLEDLDDSEIEVLVSLGTSVIDILFDYFMLKDNASIMYYSDTREWVEEFCEGVLKGEI